MNASNNPLDGNDGLEASGARWAISAIMVLGVIMLAVAGYLASSVTVDSFVKIEDGSGQIHIRGTERKFVGYATGTYAGRQVLVEGLPKPSQLGEIPIAWRALCSVRSDPQTDWSHADPSLKVHLHSEEMEEACRPFEGLELETR